MNWEAEDELDGPMLPVDYPGERPVEELEDEITELYGHVTAATHRLLLLIAELDRRGRYGAWGLRSCAHWLNYKCGIGMGAAREKVRVARALPKLPKISAAFAAGEVSYSKVRAMTRVATSENEDYLLMIARHGTASQVETLVREYRSVIRVDELERADKQHEQRDLSWYWDDDGSLVVHGRLPPEQGALFIKSLDAAREALYQDDPWRYVSAETSKSGVQEDSADTAQCKNVSAETSMVNEVADDWTVPKREDQLIGARRADALAIMAECYLAKGPASLSGGDRYLVTVHVDEAVLDDPGAEGRAGIEDGPWLASDTVRRLACDSGIVQMLDDKSGLPLDVGRRTRSIPPAIRRALKVRDGGCRFPGCTQKQWVDGHHIRHWADGGETRLDNLVLLCRFHHRLVHEEGFDLYRDVHGQIRFKRPDGRALPPTGPPPRRPSNLRFLLRAHRRLGFDINADTCVPQGGDGWMDHAMAIDALCDCDGRL
ncbi:HNH endonuclease signature motif containing protein [soil metagenome]